MSELQDFYSQRLTSLQTQETALNAKGKNLSLLRILSILVSIALIYPAIKFNGYFFLGAFLFLCVFLYLVKRHVLLLDELTILQKVISINEDELKLINMDKSVFDKGEDIDVHLHPYALDLDIFGTGSIFQSVNRTATREGRMLLSNALLNPLDSDTEIRKRKEAAKELMGETDWRQNFMAIGKLSEERANDLNDVRDWIRIPSFYEQHPSLLWFARICPAISAGVFLAMIPTGTFQFFWFIALLIVNSTILAFYSKETKTYFRHFGERTALFTKFSKLFALISKKQFNETLNKDIHDRVAEAAVAFQQLSKISNTAEQRMNGLAGPLMNGLLLFDAWSIRRIERWRIQHKDKVESWLHGLSEMDMLNSFANFRFNHKHFTDATIVTDKKIMDAVAMAHPMMPNAIAVTNNYRLGFNDRAHIVTGSNMAGKSTFIRAVGLNMVLALNGLPVCASTFSCSILKIVSCIRITDSLEENASYFKAEITRLSQIMTQINSGLPHLVLLDEILRGTNSDDKRMGTLAFFRKVGSKNCLALLATHDLHVGALQKENPTVFSNYCFESSIDQTGLHFDYKLREGVSSTTNATHLMRNMGLID